jgi:hypothetical protein
MSLDYGNPKIQSRADDRLEQSQTVESGRAENRETYHTSHIVLLRYLACYLLRVRRGSVDDSDVCTSCRSAKARHVIGTSLAAMPSDALNVCE